MLLAMGAVLAERWLRTLRAGAAPLSRPSTSQASSLFPSSNAPSFFRWRLAARSSNTLSATATTCAKKSAGTISSAPSPRFAIRFRPTSRRTSASPPATTASTAPLTFSVEPMGSLSPSVPPTPNGSAAIRRLHPQRSSSSGSRASKPTRSSPVAAGPATTATPKASTTKRAKTTPTSSSAALHACPVQELWKEHQDFG